MGNGPVIGIVGLGTMGLGIAQVFVQAGFSVLAADADAATRGSAATRLGAALDSRVAMGKLDAGAREGMRTLLSVVDTPAQMGAVALLIEAIAERVEAKRALFAGLEAVVAKDAVLATNTSSLSVASVAVGLDQPTRVVGLHFFNPAPAMRLVELIGHSGSDPAALALARQVTEAAGKTVIRCPDTPGFIVNRCARPFYSEALALLEEGRSAGEIDAAMLAAGYRIGPLSLIDLIGADINLAATEGLSAAMDGHPRYHVFGALKDQVARGKLGRKTGRGFVFPGAVAEAPADAGAIALRIEAVLANEAAWLLSQDGVAAEDIDTAMMLGLNFPRGPLAGLRAHGLPRILGVLAGLEARAPAHLKGRYVMPPALSEVG